MAHRSSESEFFREQLSRDPKRYERSAADRDSARLGAMITAFVLPLGAIRALCLACGACALCLAGLALLQCAWGCPVASAPATLADVASSMPVADMAKLPSFWLFALWLACALAAFAGRIRISARELVPALLLGTCALAVGVLSASIGGGLMLALAWAVPILAAGTLLLGVLPSWVARVMG